MKRWLRRLRGAMGIGLAWAVAWFGAGMVLLLVVGPDAADVPFPLGFGALGFLAGVTFALVLGAVEGRRRFDQLSVPRFAAWGGAGGLLFSLLFAVAVVLSGDAPLEIVVVAPVFALAGAASAAGTLALARRAEDPALPESGGAGDAAELGP